MFRTVKFQKMKNIATLSISLCLLIVGCQSSNHSLPKERFNQFQSGTTKIIKHDSLIIHFKNPVHCPLRYKLNSSDAVLKNLLPSDWIQLKKLQDSVMVIKNPAFAKATPSDITISARLGNPDLEVKHEVIQFPTKKGKSVSMMQVYHGTKSHFKKSSEYALDFAMKEGDTIYAADAGRIVGVVKDYINGGNDVKWTPYSNFITVYNERANWFIQYVHIPKDGSFVKVGDSIRAGQPIGLVGTTGYTSKEHLHFNVFKSTNEGNGIASIPTEFVGIGDGEYLKQGQKVLRQ